MTIGRNKPVLFVRGLLSGVNDQSDSLKPVGLHNLGGDAASRVLELTSQGFWMVNADFVTVEVNSALCNMLGYTPEEMLGHSPLEFVHTDDYSILTEKSSSITRTPHRQYRISWVHKDGRRIYTDVRATTFKNENRNWAFAFIEDVTRERENELALQASEQKYRTLIENIQDGVFILHEREVSYVNSALARMLGYSTSEMTGSRFSNYLVREDMPLTMSALDKLEAGRTDSVKLELKMNHSNGIAEVFVNLLAGIDRENNRIVGTIKDISDRKRNEEQLKRAHDELHDAYREIFVANKRLAETNLRLRSIAHTDSLTGVANRRQFNEILEREWQRISDEKGYLSLILFDVDHFKAYNDHYGHRAGDRCLISVARTLEGLVYSEGFVLARYGGEEFAVVVYNRTFEETVELAREMRAAIAELKLEHHGIGEKGIVTVSLGVGEVAPAEVENTDVLIQRADKALYKAKENGRNRVEVFEE